MQKYIIFMILLLCSLAYAETTSNKFILKSSAFTNESNISAKYTCDGQNISPALTWSGAPPQTKSLVLIVSDPDAPSGIFYHWLVYNLPASTTKLASNAHLSEKALIGKNSWGKTQYNGPCPPSGIHHYIFRLYALDTILPLSQGETIQTVLDAMQNHIIEQTELVGLYGHYQQ